MAMVRLRQMQITDWLYPSGVHPSTVAVVVDDGGENVLDEDDQHGVQRAAWPSEIDRVDVCVNLSSIAFCDLTGDVGKCSCIGGCWRGLCVNATAGFFCDVANCGVDVNCGNRCQELSCLELVVTPRTGLGVASTLSLPPNVCVG
jgi:hypothetical protein